MAKKLYVGNLSYNTVEDDLRETFSKFGEVVSATLIVDQTNGRSKGFGFVEMSSDEGRGQGDRRPERHIAHGPDDHRERGQTED